MREAPKMARISRRGRWHIVDSLRPHGTVIAKCGRAIATKRRGAEKAMDDRPIEDVCGLCMAVVDQSA